MKTTRDKAKYVVVVDYSAYETSAFSFDKKTEALDFYHESATKGYGVTFANVVAVRVRGAR